MKKILWISRSTPGDSQVEGLRTLHGSDVEVTHLDLPNGSDAANEFEAGRYDDIVAVVPLAVLDHFLRQRLRPLWSEAVEEIDPTKVEFRGGDRRGYRFNRYRRVTEVSLELTPVETQEMRRVLRFTRHQTLPEEAAEIRHLFGQEVRIETDSRPFRDGREIRERFQRSGADDLLVVAPYGMLDQLTKSGIKPLWGEVMNERFVALHRLNGVRVRFEDEG